VVYALLHKPAGLITAMSDIRGRPTVASLMPPSWRGSVGPVGRLDKDTTGALLITDDGDLSQLLTQPDHEVWKRYEVELDQAIGEADERLEALRRGVVLGGVTTLPARAGALPGGSGLWICLREGKKRQVRKMVRAVGLRLVHLHRSHVGPLSLGDEPSGSLRILEDSEVDELYEAAGGRDEPRRRAEAALAKRLEAGTLDERSERLAQAYMASGLALEARNV
jgi:pseudouridine synthase